MRVLLIDNYDSFTWNLVHLIGGLGAQVDVRRNDALSVDDALEGGHDAIVLSPGPCTPNEAGICLDLVKQGAAVKPIFGVCLGLQTMGQAFGGDVVRAPSPMHGKVSPIRHKARGLFRGINGPLQATRYHSLVVARETCPDVFDIEAETDDGLIMALSHRDLPVCGVQFHPESIASEHGGTILRNFLDLAQRWRSEHDAPALSPSA
ncbi:aminodeoxychorismate/anthranilate synthase component II [Bosea sp. (in: a-proteobacteria)]|uniref:anthranilate synthase component II n=1 Tax=Bosea sp. (in: a-proteobacteria) TaxID=1871050 RepID=UPI00121C7262|nr:aminodeoxychorismate/anthranilate synthase component II [Bosea sp. (in: a-proteobacteria)]TAJ31028.1 MAG: aminodeoxychorismate/anthranilate synthase component II [Bosea sp. (in: a-proteobacteria)]